ncbi:hypothetical protein J3R30DRAFT_1844801 [Lentinula aciculospora]|uniref:Uncharacterized protein n=1 Tax=Lentinula aciculospora TaxID=153920 RepID=A0A9W9AKC5_9AGAR|nr:hypothetical protein J3R30DRAFT_1844801 [Lentinula aciculospora]
MSETFATLTAHGHKSQSRSRIYEDHIGGQQAISSINRTSEVQQVPGTLAGQDSFIEYIKALPQEPLPDGWTRASLADHLDYVLRRRMEDNCLARPVTPVEMDNEVSTENQRNSTPNGNHDIMPQSLTKNHSETNLPSINAFDNSSPDTPGDENFISPAQASYPSTSLFPPPANGLGRCSSLSLVENCRDVPHQQQHIEMYMPSAQWCRDPLSVLQSSSSHPFSLKNLGLRAAGAEAIVQTGNGTVVDPRGTGPKGVRSRPYPQSSCRTQRKKPGEHEPDFVHVHGPNNSDQVCQWVIETDQHHNALEICGEHLTTAEGAKVHLLYHRNNDQSHFDSSRSEPEAAGSRIIRCAWLGCKKTMQSKFFSRHVQSTHLEMRVLCLRCGDTLKRSDEEKRHRAVQCERSCLRARHLTPQASQESLATCPGKEPTPVFAQRL